MKWEVLWLLGASCQSSSHFAIPGILSVSPATFLSLKNNLRFQTVFFWCVLCLFLPRSMSSHDPLQRFFRRLLPVGRFGHGDVHDHTCGHNSSVVGSLKMPTEAMENGIILDDSYWTWWFSMATSKKKLREKLLDLIIIFERCLFDRNTLNLVPNLATQIETSSDCQWENFPGAPLRKSQGFGSNLGWIGRFKNDCETQLVLRFEPQQKPYVFFVSSGWSLATTTWLWARGLPSYQVSSKTHRTCHVSEEQLMWIKAGQNFCVTIPQTKFEHPISGPGCPMSLLDWHTATYLETPNSRFPNFCGYPGTSSVPIENKHSLGWLGVAPWHP